MGNPETGGLPAPQQIESPPPQPAATAASQAHTVLFVDDEEHILSALQRLFRKEGYHLITAPGGQEALELMGRHQVVLVVSDQRMPGMSGAELLQQVRERYPDTQRVILTGYSEMSAAIAAINEGQVYRFISKPWNDDEIKLVVRDALRRYELLEENRRLLELTQRQNAQLLDLNQNLERRVQERTEEIRQKGRELEKLYAKLEENFFETIRVFLQLIEMFDPALGGHSKRVGALAAAVAGRFGLDEAESQLVEVAGILHDIGLIGLPREVLTKPEQDMTQAEAALYRQHPVLGYTTLGAIDTLKQVAVLVKTHHERFSGEGFPDRLRGEEIPLGGRIICAASAYDDLVHLAGQSPSEALSQLKKRSGPEFDSEVVFNLQVVLQTAATTVRQRETVLPLSKLQPGMILARNLKTISGRLLLPEGATIAAAHIEKLANFSKIDPISGGIHVYLPAS
jgi:response regulator RpfG family c-di-GMP phosphodiesterase